MLILVVYTVIGTGTGGRGESNFTMDHPWWMGLPCHFAFNGSPGAM